MIYLADHNTVQRTMEMREQHSMRYNDIGPFVVVVGGVVNVLDKI